MVIHSTTRLQWMATLCSALIELQTAFSKIMASPLMQIRCLHNAISSEVTKAPGIKMSPSCSGTELSCLVTGSGILWCTHWFNTMHLYFWGEFILNLLPSDQKVDCFCPFPRPILCAYVFLAIFSIILLHDYWREKTSSGHNKRKLTSQQIPLAGFHGFTFLHSIDWTRVVQDR